MRLGGQYVLGIDALPRGTFAAIAVAHQLTETFAIAGEGAKALPLEERVRAAVEQAQELRGGPPAEVRLICIDDGGDGTELSRVHEWLVEVVKAKVEVLDVVGHVAPEVTDDPSVEELAGAEAQSIARAGQAALW